MASKHLANAAHQIAQWRKRNDKGPRKRSTNPLTKDFQEYVRKTGTRIAWHEGWSSPWSTDSITKKLAEAQLEHRQPILAAAIEEARRQVRSAREDLERREAALSLIEAIAAGGNETTIRQQRRDAEQARETSDPA